MELSSMDRPKDNIELVTGIMSFSRRGAMSQLVVIQAITSYVESVTAIPKEEYLEVVGSGSLVDGEAWYDTCQELKEKLNAFYGDMS